jgi:predicted RNA-binding protein
MLAGEVVNEDAFIAAVEKKLAGMGVSMDDILEDDRRKAEKAAATAEEWAE